MVNASRGTGKLEHRVVAAAEAALERQRFVSAIDVLVGVGWLTHGQVDQWRQGRVEYLERLTAANLHRVSRAMAIFRRWAPSRGLLPSETDYVARTRDRRRLRFSASGDPTIERAYRTHWVSPELSEAKRQRLADQQSRPPDLLVISPVSDWTCTVCSDTDDLLMMEEAGLVCMCCADLDRLILLPSGDAALTRRAKKAPVGSPPSSSSSAGHEVGTSVGVCWWRRRLWRSPSESVWPMTKSAGDVASGTKRRAPSRTKRSTSPSPRRSRGCSRDARRRGRPPSRDTRQRETAAGWAGRRRGARWRSGRRPWPSSRRCAMSTLPMTIS